MKNTPFTYLIYCKSTKQYYYGVRYSKNCSPTDLWKTYFTSSSYVKELIKKYGKSDFLFEIRKLFNNSNDARIWEQKVLLKLNVSVRADFINKTNTGLVTGENRIWITNGTDNKFIEYSELPIYPLWIKGRTFSENTRKKISKANKGKLSGDTNPMFGKTHSIEQRKKFSDDRKGRLCGRVTSKSVSINGVLYPTIKEAMLSTGISRYIIVKNYL